MNERTEGEVVMVHQHKGFGFFRTLYDNSEVFFHFSDFEEEGIKPSKGDKFTYGFGMGRNGKVKAINIKRMEETRNANNDTL